MDLSQPRYAGRDALFAARPARAAGLRCQGAWVSGTLDALNRPSVAIVGSRAPSDAGRSRAGAVAQALAEAGICIISGLALGIDGAAHAGALAGGGVTVGILGGGHRQFFPRRNRTLGEAIVAAGGAVLSPYPPDEPARPYQFLQRNGIVAALADAVVVVEAAERSGALNTASWAAGSGIDVLAFPGDVDRPKSAGCNALIRDGATLVRHAGDILDALGITAAGSIAMPWATEPCDATERALLAALRHGPADLDALVAGTGTQAAAAMAALVRLEIDGLLERRADTLQYAVRAPANATAREDATRRRR